MQENTLYEKIISQTYNSRFFCKINPDSLLSKRKLYTYRKYIFPNMFWCKLVPLIFCNTYKFTYILRVSCINLVSPLTKQSFDCVHIGRVWWYSSFIVYGTTSKS